MRIHAIHYTRSLAASKKLTTTIAAAGILAATGLTTTVAAARLLRTELQSSSKSSNLSRESVRFSISLGGRARFPTSPPWMQPAPATWSTTASIPASALPAGGPPAGAHLFAIVSLPSASQARGVSQPLVFPPECTRHPACSLSTAVGTQATRRPFRHLTSPTKMVARIESLEYVEMAELLQEAWLAEPTPDSSALGLTLRLPRRSSPITDISAAASRSLSWATEDQALHNGAFSGRAKLTSKLLHFQPTATDVLALARARCSFQGGSTPLCPDAWARLLHAHPDSAFSTYLINGLINRFCVRFNHRQPLGAVTKNMPSALKQQTIVAAYINNKITLIGPLPTNVAQFVHRNQIGVVPKGHTPGKWRLITHLSFPPGYSVNNGIDPVLCSLSYMYVSIDTIAVIVASLGAGSLLAKIDIESAYRLVPVHPDDRPLLGVEWSGHIYCDAMLPFGLSLVPAPSHRQAHPHQGYFTGLERQKGMSQESRRELESLIGFLQHACKVVKPGRSFLRRMINLLSGPFTSRGHHLVPGADPDPQPIPSRLISALLCKDGDWSSPTWRE
eukprot:Em0076g12a